MSSSSQNISAALVTGSLAAVFNSGVTQDSSVGVHDDDGDDAHSAGQQQQQQHESTVEDANVGDVADATADAVNIGNVAAAVNQIEMNTINDANDSDDLVEQSQQATEAQAPASVGTAGRHGSAAPLRSQARKPASSSPAGPRARKRAQANETDPTVAREEIDQILSRLTKVEAFMNPHQSLIGNMADRIDSLNAHINQQVAELFDKVASNCKEFELHLSPLRSRWASKWRG